LGNGKVDCASVRSGPWRRCSGRRVHRCSARWPVGISCGGARRSRAEWTGTVRARAADTGMQWNGIRTAVRLRRSATREPANGLGVGSAGGQDCVSHAGNANSTRFCSRVWGFFDPLCHLPVTRHRRRRQALLAGSKGIGWSHRGSILSPLSGRPGSISAASSLVWIIASAGAPMPGRGVQRIPTVVRARPRSSRGAAVALPWPCRGAAVMP
jgi:hypothetical protein